MTDFSHHGVPVGRYEKLKLFVVMMLVATSAGVLYLMDPAGSSFFPPCPFHAVTKLHCPGCGSLRAIHQLLHGKIAAAFAFNPLTVSVVPFLGYAFLSYIVKAINGKGLPTMFIPASWIRTFLGGVILFAILRNIPVYPFYLLAP
jgi:uncharacterized protein with PQ loop repeat